MVSLSSSEFSGEVDCDLGKQQVDVGRFPLSTSLEAIHGNPFDDIEKLFQSVPPIDENYLSSQKIDGLQQTVTSSISVISPLSNVSSQQSDVTLPLSDVTSPLNDFVCPQSNVTSPLCDVTPSISDVTTSFPDLTPPLSVVTTPLHDADPPHLGVTSPLSDVTSPLSDVTTYVFDSWPEADSQADNWISDDLTSDIPAQPFLSGDSGSHHPDWSTGTSLWASDSQFKSVDFGMNDCEETTPLGALTSIPITVMELAEPQTTSSEPSSGNTHIPLTVTLSDDVRSSLRKRLIRRTQSWAGLPAVTCTRIVSSSTCRTRTRSEGDFKVETRPSRSLGGATSPSSLQAGKKWRLKKKQEQIKLTQDFHSLMCQNTKLKYTVGSLRRELDQLNLIFNHHLTTCKHADKIVHQQPPK